MKRSKTALILTIITIFTLLLGACSNNAQNTPPATTGQNTPATNDPKPEAPKEEDTTPVTIQYWHSHNEVQMDILKKMISEFQKENPHITVEEVFQGGYPDLHKKLQAAVAANEVPAVTNVEVASLPNFADSGVFTDLTPFIERDAVDMEDFSSGMLQAYSYNGRQYGFPLIVAVSVMIYNKTLLDSLGVTPPQTWDEIDGFIEKVAVKEGKETKRYAFAVPGWDAWYTDPWMINGGGTVLSEDKKSVGFDQPDGLRWLENLRKWTTDGTVQMGYGPGASSNMRQMFLDEQIAMVHHSSATLKSAYMGNAKFELGVSFLPGDKKRISNIGGAGIVMMDKAPDAQKEAAWKFIKFMTGKEHNVEWAKETGYLPTRKSVVDTEEGKAYFAELPQYKVVFDNFDNVIGRPQHPAYTEINGIYMEAVGKMILEGADPFPLLKSKIKEMNDILQEY
ncbi:ABC transporter substrate-binding protein [Paenibacillus nasutitermitis]|uniref:ABC transporter substrate-binding protein n=1 Tax=Paenibacillus nasutitermitis TaxID=1652958 RepID=A0A916Z922_9BACL|nr:ABC transporter substrate-binding protein [Paenibacillus nasutitermitis]GGD81933.1 ABC transporter substrate-binding protein [Paenibacillus nasutitermitis]